MKNIIILLSIIAFPFSVVAQTIDVNSIVNSAMQKAQDGINQSLESIEEQPSNSDSYVVSNTQLVNQSFAGRDLTNAIFSNVTLTNCNFDNAILANAKFSNVIINNSSFKKAAFANSTISNTSFSNSDLRGSNFDGSTISNTSFGSETMLYAVDFSKAKVSNVTYDGANFDTSEIINSEAIRNKLTEKKIGNNAKIDLAILFETNSDTLKESAWKQLNELSNALSDSTLANSKFLIEGHTDSVGTDEYNKDLSYRRAFSVKKALTNQLGIESSRLDVKGFGESQPTSTNDTEYGRTLNRRVTIVNLGE